MDLFPRLYIEREFDDRISWQLHGCTARITTEPAVSCCPREISDFILLVLHPIAADCLNPHWSHILVYAACGIPLLDGTTAGSWVPLLRLAVGDSTVQACRTPAAHCLDSVSSVVVRA